MPSLLYAGACCNAACGWAWTGRRATPERVSASQALQRVTSPRHSVIEHDLSGPSVPATLGGVMLSPLLGQQLRTFDALS